MGLENLKTIRDRLNANKSRLAQETRVKLNKYANHEYIQILENLVKKDQDKIKNMQEIKGGLTKKHIDEAINHVFNQPQPKPKERVAKVLRGCIHSNQLVEMMYSCGDPECPGCSNIQKLFQDEVKSQMEEFRISEEIRKECDRQDQKWGVRNQHPLAWLAILMEEVGEVTQEVNDAHHDIYRMNLENYRTELVQCGAVIQQMIKNIQHYE